MYDEQALLKRVKVCIRTTSNTFDKDEILPLIKSAFLDLKGAGVNINDEANKSIIEQAVIFYCRAYFGISPNSEWVSHYESLRDAIAARRDISNEQ